MNDSLSICGFCSADGKVSKDQGSERPVNLSLSVELVMISVGQMGLCY